MLRLVVAHLTSVTLIVVHFRMKEASPQLLNPPGEEITNHDDLVSSIPNRWSPIETSLLSELRVLCSEEIAAAKPFPEVVGDRRLMRFLRGHN